MSPRSPLLAAVAAALVATAAHAEILPLLDMVNNGEATYSASLWDIGHENSLINGNFVDLYRSASVNPIEATIGFNVAQTISAARGKFSHTQYYEWQLEAADSLSHLNSKTGSYVLVFGPTQVPGDYSIQWEEWNDAPITKRWWRFTVERITGDDFVHIHELELQTYAPPADIEIDNEIVTINTIVVTPADAEVATGVTQQYAAEASLSYGPDRYDVTDLVTWSTGDSGLITIDPAGLATGVVAGETTVEADYDVVHGETPVTVRFFRPADINVGFIHRTPEYNRFKVDFSGDQQIHPSYIGEKKWPDPGETVTYNAHIFNKGDAEATNIEYRWFFDDVEVDAGTIASIPGQDKVILSYSAPWPADTVQNVSIPAGAMDLDPQQLERAIGDHRIRCEVDPNDLIAESCELNNVVEDYINALSFWAFMDETTYALFNKHLSFLESYSAEDWAQMQLEGFERRLWAGGTTQRMRLDHVAVYPDGDLNGGGTHEPIGSETRQADGRWGFQIGEWPESKVMRFAKIVENPLMHEWGHQIGLIDVYTYDIATGNCLITYDGAPVAGTALMPTVSPWNVYYGNIRVFNNNGTAEVDSTERALMADTSQRFIAAGSAAGMQRNLGLRRGFFGDYLGAIQQGDIKLRIESFGGAPVASCNLRIFQRNPDGKVYDIPKFSGVTNASGEWTFPGVTLPGWEGGLTVNNPWSWTNGVTDFDTPNSGGGNAPLIVELEFGNEVEYHFVEVDALNVAMQDGVTGDYTVTLITYASRLPNTLPTIDFSNGSQYIYLTEGDTFEATISATDVDGDPVTLSATPLHNSHFDPDTGAFVFKPDSLQVNRYDGYTEAMAVRFRADDGKFTATRTMWFYVSDDPNLAFINRGGYVLTGDVNCDGVVDTYDIDAFVLALASQTNYEAAYPGCNYQLADCNADGSVDTYDIDAFVALLAQ